MASHQTIPTSRTTAAENEQYGTTNQDIPGKSASSPTTTSGGTTCSEQVKSRWWMTFLAILGSCFRLDEHCDFVSPECCNRRISVYCRIDGSERRWWATARFDTQSNVNLISARWLRDKNIDPRILDRIPGEPKRVNRIEGDNELVGTVNIGWYGDDVPYINQQVYLKPRTIWGDFQVEEPGEGFDIIIGWPTISEEKLFKKEWFSYARNAGGNIPRKVPLSALERQAAEEARKRERALQQETRREQSTQPRTDGSKRA